VVLYIAVDREVLRRLLFEDGSLSDLLLSAFVQRRELLQQRDGIGIEIVGPRESDETRRLLDFARNLRLPHSWFDPEENEDAATLIAQLDLAEVPVRSMYGTHRFQRRRDRLKRRSRRSMLRVLAIRSRIRGAF
jgi:thioredoxin reductase (NADPH)